MKSVNQQFFLLDFTICLGIHLVCRKFYCHDHERLRDIGGVLKRDRTSLSDLLREIARSQQISQNDLENVSRDVLRPM